MKLIIEIYCDNAAFDPITPEVVRILERYVDWIKHIQDIPNNYRFKDYNGNTVGSATTIKL